MFWLAKNGLFLQCSYLFWGYIEKLYDKRWLILIVYNCNVKFLFIDGIILMVMVLMLKKITLNLDPRPSYVLRLYSVANYKYIHQYSLLTFKQLIYVFEFYKQLLWWVLFYRASTPIIFDPAFVIVFFCFLFTLQFPSPFCYYLFYISGSGNGVEPTLVVEGLCQLSFQSVYWFPIFHDKSQPVSCDWFFIYKGYMVSPPPPPTT